MNHIAIDLGSKESQICVRGPDGAILEERKHPTRKLVELVADWQPSRVVMETTAEAFRIADTAKLAGHEVRVVPGTLVRRLGIGERGVKNDQKDAQRLSKASWQTDVPTVHIPSHQSRELKSLCGARDVLVTNQRNLSNNIRGWMRTQLWRIRGGKMKTLPDRLRAHAAMLGTTLPEHVERQLQMLSLTTEQVEAATKQVKKFADAHPDCRRFMTVPGVGPITAVRFLAAIDDPSRFSSSHRVQSYIGLTPGERSSGMTQRMTGITKAGQAELRRCLVQAAWSAMNVKSIHPMMRWAHKVADRRGRGIAMVALARKIAGILFAIWRDGTTYDSARAALKVLQPA